MKDKRGDNCNAKGSSWAEWCGTWRCINDEIKLDMGVGVRFLITNLISVSINCSFYSLTLYVYSFLVLILRTSCHSIFLMVQFEDRLKMILIVFQKHLLLTELLDQQTGGTIQCPGLGCSSRTCLGIILRLQGVNLAGWRRIHHKMAAGLWSLCQA